MDQILFSRFTRDLFQVKVEYENMILQNPNVCNLFKEIKGASKTCDEDGADSGASVLLIRTIRLFNEFITLYVILRKR